MVSEKTHFMDEERMDGGCPGLDIGSADATSRAKNTAIKAIVKFYQNYAKDKHTDTVNRSLSRVINKAVVR